MIDTNRSPTTAHLGGVSAARHVALHGAAGVVSELEVFGIEGVTAPALATILQTAVLEAGGPTGRHALLDGHLVVGEDEGRERVVPLGLHVAGLPVVVAGGAGGAGALVGGVVEDGDPAPAAALLLGVARAGHVAGGRLAERRRLRQELPAVALAPGLDPGHPVVVGLAEALAALDRHVLARVAEPRQRAPVDLVRAPQELEVARLRVVLQRALPGREGSAAEESEGDGEDGEHRGSEWMMMGL